MPRLPDLSPSWSATPVGLGLTVILVYLTVQPATFNLVALAVGAALGLFAVQRAPRLGAAVMVGAIAFVPIYWAIPPGLLPSPITPMVLAGVVLLPLALMSRGHWRPTSIDWLALLYVTALVISYFDGYAQPALLTVHLTLMLVLPYLAFRLLFQRDAILRAATIGIIASAAALATIGIQQRLTGVNPFLTWRTPGYLADIWTIDTYRFAEVRASASFGQPLVFGTFLAAVIVLALPFVFNAGGRSRLVAVALEGLLVAALFATSSRGPLLMVAVGLMLYIAGNRQGGRAQMLIAAAIAVALGYFFTPMGPLVERLLTSLESGGDRANVTYRFSLLRLLLDPEYFSLFGRGTGGGIFEASGVLGRSIDSQYVLVYLQSGIVALALFVCLVIPVASVALRHPDPLRRAWAVATLVTFQGVLSVALLLQQADVFWIGVAATAASQATLTRTPPTGSRPRGASWYIPRQERSEGSAPIQLPTPPWSRSADGFVN